jgi:hypothetical protein
MTAVGAVREGAVETGERLGFYETIAEAGVADARTLASRARVALHDAAAWLKRQHDAGYLDRDQTTGGYRLFCPVPRAA